MNLAEALDVFSMDAVPTPGGLVVAYRAAAKLAHPDTGGSEEAMQRLNAAKAVLEAAEPGTKPDDGRQRCAFCRGTGTIRSGFITKTCSGCNGTGYVTRAPVSETKAEEGGHDPIAEMVADLPETWSLDSRRRTARRLYNAGWRKMGHG